MNWRDMAAPFGAIALFIILLGYALFFAAGIRPSMEARDTLQAQLGNERQTLQAAEKLPEAKPDDLKTRVANAKSTLSAAAGLFLNESQAAQIINALYGYANDAHVSIGDLQTLPAPTPGTKDLWRVTSIRLQAQGTSQNLIDFMARLKESSMRGMVVTSFSLTGGDTNAGVLIVTISFYTSSPGLIDGVTTDLPAGNIIPTPPATGVKNTTPTSVSKPGATATPKFVIHVVRTGETLSTIARLYGTTVEAIIIANHLTNFNVTVGQQLAIPKP